MTERVIKKYSNRRLYDTLQSRYITLNELKAMVVNGEKFRICESKTNEDLTCATLLQVLLSEEGDKKPVFSESSLRNLVVFMNGPMRGPMSIYLEQCLPIFVEAQSKLEERFGSSLGASEIENIAVLQSKMTRQILEQYVFHGIENFLGAQQQMQQNMKDMMTGNMFGMPNFFKPPDKE
ncbi:polyhydroxyalkanoate synthesis repressor PhaR [Candidatus Persebacteraceae bacterium Df01]|jgi:polyhydroxyalkanoate synthesis repressor PhaR|uniref:Polyhydroxyalkanoate synthesis repressor PhaR n=1 Tax=Candidatus Doriopsillibacter californiensis TaxID=2970740 RepID=A0ABT7QNC6_9GAMM|nr:polyhydroxyalkanoate synthesis repressor PhaR [Candidatus Persebacteraceae bacterium Df01]